jgi:hypothetical protein
MEVTLNVCNSFIEQHQEKLLHGKSIRITNFKVAPKTNYDHGEVECILLVEQETSIENIAPICQEYNFIPNTSIRILLATTNTMLLEQ